MDFSGPGWSWSLLEVFRWYLVVVGGVWPVSPGHFVEFWRIYVDFDGFFF